MKARFFHCLAVSALVTSLFAAGCGNDGCPKDLAKARGASCAKEQKVCSENTPFHLSLICTEGTWVDGDHPK